MSFLLAYCVLIAIYSFTIYGKYGNSCYRTVRLNVRMKWQFGGEGSKSREDLGIVGSEGEFYFDPNKPAVLKGAASLYGKKQTIPIFPCSSTLIPLATDFLNVFEMRHRQLIYDVGDGLFGYSHYSQQNRKLSLVGTLARIKNRKLLNDGRTFVIIEGVKRFYITDFVSERPYVKAKVCTFGDYSENPTILDALEQKIFKEVRVNIKFMELLYPSKTYVIGANILKYRPTLRLDGVRQVSLASEEAEMQRRANFSFAVMDMLQINAQVKLMLLQDHLIESRLKKILRILEKGGDLLRKEAIAKGEQSAIDAIDDDTTNNYSDIDDIFPPESWSPENYLNGKWTQAAVMMQ